MTERDKLAVDFACWKNELRHPLLVGPVMARILSDLGFSPGQEYMVANSMWKLGERREITSRMVRFAHISIPTLMAFAIKDRSLFDYLEKDDIVRDLPIYAKWSEDFDDVILEQEIQDDL